MTMDSERKRKRGVAADRRRRAPWSKWYSSKAWRRARAGYLAAHPDCCICGEQATVIDHIQPHRGDKALFWTIGNWRPMCKRCHDRHTAARGGGFGNRERADGVDPGCGEDGLPTRPRPHWG